MLHLRSIYDGLATFLATAMRSDSSLPKVFENLCQKHIRNHLIFILSDSLEFPKEQYFRSIAEQNDCVFIHIFDTFENTLEKENIHIIGNDTDLFIDTSDEKKRVYYVQERTKELELCMAGVNRRLN